MPTLNEPKVRGSWPLVQLDADGRPRWHIAGTNPPKYDYDLHLERLWRKGRKTMQQTITTLHGDCRERLADLPERSIQCVVTSPPYYGLRKYSDDPREIGQEATPAAYVAALVEVFRGVRRVLRDDGVVWLNLGDSYNGGGPHHGDKNLGKSGTNKGSAGGIDRRVEGLKDKDLMGIPWRVVFALQDDGWYLRSDVIWSKPNCMPESVTDRPTRAHEYVFMLTKSARYFYDAAAVAEPAIYVGDNRAARADNANDARLSPSGRAANGKPQGTTRNRRTVWSIPTQPYSGAHYATMPEALIEPCILAGSSAKACEHCGAAWVRVVVREDQGWDGSKYGERVVEASGGAKSGGTARSTLGSSNGKLTGKSITTGSAPGCACPDNAGSAASVVLDPFGGSGTVGRVALRLQRRAVLIELNQAYIDEHIEKRTNGAQIEMFV